MSNETDLDWLARNVHEWPAGDHQPWCYVYWKGGQRAVSGNCITVIQPCVRVEMSECLARRAELQSVTEQFKPSIEEANRLAQEFKPFTSIEDNQEQDMKQDNKWFERGELPPVGVVCIFEPGSGSCYFNEYDLKASGKIVKIIAHTRYEHSSCDVAVFRWDLDGCFGVSTGNTHSFRPIRTEREVLIEIIKKTDDTDDKIADAILAAGFSLRDK